MALKDIINNLKEGAGKAAEKAKRLAEVSARGEAYEYLYGYANLNIDNGDFGKGSLISIINGKAVIYGIKQDDYAFNADDIESFSEGKPETVLGNCSAVSCNIKFKDGKSAVLHLIEYLNKENKPLITNRLEDFKREFNL